MVQRYSIILDSPRELQFFLRKKFYPRRYPYLRAHHSWSRVRSAELLKVSGGRRGYIFI